MTSLTTETLPIEFVDQLTFNSKRNPHGSSVKDLYPFLGAPPIPDLLYFVYISLDANGKLIVRQVSDRVGIRGIDAAEIALFDQAKRGDANPAKVEGTNFDNLVFKESCYFTMAIDHPTWKFYDSPYVDHDPFVFITRKEKIVSGRPVIVSYDPNYSFYDANVRPIAGRVQSSVRTVNYFRADITGRPVQPNELQYYGFEIYIRVPFSLAGTGDQYATVLIDPDGTNQGPPP